MQENGFALFVAILFQLWRKTNFYIFENCYDQRFHNFADMISRTEKIFFVLFLKREEIKNQIQ